MISVYTHYGCKRPMAFHVSATQPERANIAANWRLWHPGLKSHERPSETIGKEVTCPDCGRAFFVPDLANHARILRLCGDDVLAEYPIVGEWMSEADQALLERRRHERMARIEQKLKATRIGIVLAALIGAVAVLLLALVMATMQGRL